MKNSIFTFIVIFAAVVFCSTSYSQDDNMKKWMEYMTPGDMHKMLSKGAGNWNMKTSFWMAPGSEPMVSEATSTGEMVMDGRYLISKVKGNMMGMPFDGMSVEGYDNAVKLFMTTWIDNMGSGIMYMTGKWDESARTIRYTGKAVDPMTANWIDVRQDVSFGSDGTVNIIMYGPGPDGKEFKTMEILSTKQ